MHPSPHPSYLGTWLLGISPEEAWRRHSTWESSWTNMFMTNKGPRPLPRYLSPAVSSECLLSSVLGLTHVPRDGKGCPKQVP